MKCENTGCVEVKIYIGSNTSLGYTNTEVELLHKLTAARIAVDCRHPVRVTPTTFLGTDDVFEPGWEIAAHRLPALSRGDFTSDMHKLARELCKTMNQQKVIVATNYETTVITNTDLPKWELV